LYFPPRSKNITTKTMRSTGYVPCIGEMWNPHKILVLKSQRKRSLWIHGRGWEHDIEMNLKEIGCADVNWLNLPQHRGQWRAPANMVMNLQVPYNAGRFLNSWAALFFSRWTLLRGLSSWTAIATELFSC
jgi:hypothetical protein